MQELDDCGNRIGSYLASMRDVVRQWSLCRLTSALQVRDESIENKEDLIHQRQIGGLQSRLDGHQCEPSLTASEYIRPCIGRGKPRAVRGCGQSDNAKS